MTKDPDNGSYLDHAAVQMGDWKESPEEVLECVDKQLREHGLEVVMAKFSGDSCGSINQTALKIWKHVVGFGKKYIGALNAS